jgi:acyl-CoA dehydrogenase
MSEHDVASSDAANVATRVERDGDEYAVNGRKWWITGAMNPNAKVFIVMGKSDPSAGRHRQQSMMLVPRDTPGLEIHRGMEVLGYDDHDHGGQAELSFTEARVPAAT